jgi:hypothetical protein
MLVTRSPKAVEKWLNDIVLNGLGWILRCIYQLLNSSLLKPSPSWTTREKNADDKLSN